MKRFLFFTICALSFVLHINAQKRVVDAVDNSPIASASIFDGSGNVVGFTTPDGDFSAVPDSEYPITIRCMGYEPLTIACPENKEWQLKPLFYELSEIVVDPSKRNVLKQTLYIREYYSLSSKTDTITYFIEHMAERFVPITKQGKFGGKTSPRIINTRCYTRHKIAEKDSFSVASKTNIPPILSFLDIKDKIISAPESFKGKTDILYEKPGKSGMSMIYKQNSQIFTMIEDYLAEKKSHSASFFPLKVLGLDISLNQLITKYIYQVNDKGEYMPGDLLEGTVSVQGDGKGKYFRKILNSDEPILIRLVVEAYVADNEYLTKEDAKEDYKNKPSYIKFEIPSIVPPLTPAIQQLVQQAKATSKK